MRSISATPWNFEHARDGTASDTLTQFEYGGSGKYDLSDNYHFLAHFGPGLQNANEINRYPWYASVLFTS